jgi:hypothetical protein
MPGDLTHESFAACLNQKCRVQPDSGTLEMELIECRKLSPGGKTNQGHREPFSLIFRGPRAPILPQRIYRFDFAQLGPLEIFIVPIGPDESGMRYEAIFT